MLADVVRRSGYDLRKPAEVSVIECEDASYSMAKHGSNKPCIMCDFALAIVSNNQVLPLIQNATLIS